MNKKPETRTKTTKGKTHIKNARSGVRRHEHVRLHIAVFLMTIRCDERQEDGVDAALSGELVFMSMCVKEKPVNLNVRECTQPEFQRAVKHVCHSLELEIKEKIADVSHLLDQRDLIPSQIQILKLIIRN